MKKKIYDLTIELNYEIAQNEHAKEEKGIGKVE